MTKLLLVLMTFLPTSLVAETIAADQPRWSLASLEGVRSNHDGANCFNGVVTALGYEDHLAHTDSIELRYFLERFCQRNLGSPHAGDVLTALREGTLEHAALFLGDGKVFEKNSIAGFFGRFDDRADSFYRTRALAESNYFNACRAPDCFVEAYTCPDDSSVRPQMRSCIEASDRFGIVALREAFQAITLTPSQKFSLEPDAYDSMERLVRSIESLNGDEECALDLVVSASSVVGHLFNLNGESNLGPSWTTAMDNLRMALKNAKGRILQFDRTERTARIFRESSWIPN